MKIPRLETLDVLRGFALFGIFITHLFSIVINEHQGYSPKVTSLINIAYLNLLFGKFYTIFSFLFGVSFHIQFQNSITRKSDFVRVYFWRLVTLFVIGSLHFLIYEGDILQVYSMLGFLLLSSRHLKERTLLILSVFFLALSIIIPAIGITRDFNAETSLLSNYLDKRLVDKYNWYLFTEGQLFVIAAFFYLGFYAGKINYFLTASIRQLKWLLVSCLIPVIISTGILATIYFTGARKNPELSNIDLIIAVSARFQQVFLTFCYISGVVILHKFSSKTFLNYLTPVGKIGLTIYISQSIFIYAFYERLVANGLIWALTAGVGSFILFSAASSIWTIKFKSGPVEWVWKKSTNLAMKMRPAKT